MRVGPSADRGDSGRIGYKLSVRRDGEVSVIRSSLVHLWKLIAPWKALLTFIAVDAVVILAIIGTDHSASREVAMRHAPPPQSDEHVWKRKPGINQIIRPSTVQPDEARLA